MEIFSEDEHNTHLATFPFHVHISSTVEDSPPMTRAKVLEYVKTIVVASS